MENKKQNDDSKSNGMELLENVIKSNERNTASNEKNIESNAQVKSDIEDLVLAIGQMQLDFEIIKEIPNDVLVFYENERGARNQFLASIPKKIETVLSKETKNYMESFKKDTKWSKMFIWGKIGVFVFAVLIFITSIIFATSWYKESIKAKSELRQDILNEMADKGKKIYDENEIRILQENTKIIQLWIKNNPKKSEDFLRFKDGFEARESK